MKKIFFLLLALSVFSCKKDTTEADQAKKDEQIIKDYIANELMNLVESRLLD